MRLPNLGVACLMLAMSSACGPSTPHDLFIDEAAAICGYFSRCGTIAKSEEQQCNTSASDYYDTYAKATADYDLDGAVAAGRLSINGSAANTCLGGIRSSSCHGESLSALATSCQHVFSGHVALGGTCGNDLECSNGFCQLSSAGTCGGVCTAFAAENASCQSLRCDVQKNFCDSGHVCRPLGGVGAACRTAVTNSECQAGLGCNGSTCQSPASAGQPCASQSGCQSGLHCVATTQTPVCAANVGSGAACSDPAACPDGQRCVGLSGSGSNGTCTNVLDLGQACSPTADACPADAPCDAQLHVCARANTGEGADCSTTASSCSSLGFVFSAPLYCDATTKVCTRKKLPGASCDPSGFDFPCATTCNAMTHLCDSPMRCL